jgi:N-acetylglucosamine-6-phosphate deacetylase
MNELLLHNAVLVLEQTTDHGGLLLRDGRIAEVFSENFKPRGFGASQTIDLQGALLTAGMIDIHIHGSAGIDVQNTDRDGLIELSRFLVSEGVTGYFATFVPSGDHDYRSAIDAVDSFVDYQYTGAAGRREKVSRILGIHFEGPFVSEHRCGALQRRYFRAYEGDPRTLETFTGVRGDGTRDARVSGSLSSRLMTLAPETPRGIELTAELARAGVRVFIGHTQADPDTLDLAFTAGAYHITHFPNALEPLHHRKPGAVAWGLVRQDVTVDCIVDLHHVDPLMLKLMYRTKGSAQIALISDAIMPTGLGDGEFLVWGEQITVTDGRTALAEGPAKGTIAGSVISMRQALKNTIGLGIPIPEAVSMATAVPARAAGIDPDRGSISKGKRGDVIAFSDDFEITLAVVDGSIALDRR